MGHPLQKGHLNFDHVLMDGYDFWEDVSDVLEDIELEELLPPDAEHILSFGFEAKGAKDVLQGDVDFETQCIDVEVKCVLEY